MTITQERKQELIAEFQIHETDTGSPDLQVAILSERIKQLTETFASQSQRSCFTPRIAQNDRATPPFTQLFAKARYRALSVPGFTLRNPSLTIDTHDRGKKQNGIAYPLNLRPRRAKKVKRPPSNIDKIQEC